MTGHGYPPCDETFWTYLDACEAAGIVIIFSAGNEGSQGLRRPADRATDDYRCFAVAAVDANDPDWPIAGFSSRGPTYCTPNGDPAIKPEIAAPGVDVRSTLPGGGYGTKSGTSMASPHVNGVVALMREYNPNMAVDEIKEIIKKSDYKFRKYFGAWINNGEFINHKEVLRNLQIPVAVFAGEDSYLCGTDELCGFKTDSLWKNGIQKINSSTHMPQTENTDSISKLLKLYLASI